MGKVPISYICQQPRGGGVCPLRKPVGNIRKSGQARGSASGLDMFHQSARDEHALEIWGGKRQLEAMRGCLPRAITNLLATEFAGWSKGIATHLGQTDSHKLVEEKPYIATLHIQEGSMTLKAQYSNSRVVTNT
jgi:hypothetical protein